jgi:hypothetical protein
MIGDYNVFTFYRGPLITVEIAYKGTWARGNARLHPDDRYDANLGLDLAYARAIERLGAKLRKKTMKVVNNGG